MAQEGTITGGDGHSWEQQPDLRALKSMLSATRLRWWTSHHHHSLINHTKGQRALAEENNLGDNLPALSNTGFSAEFPLSRVKISSHKALCKYEETWAVKGT